MQTLNVRSAYYAHNVPLVLIKKIELIHELSWIGGRLPLVVSSDLVMNNRSLIMIILLSLISDRRKKF